MILVRNKLIDCNIRDSVVAIGNFDGVHIGHKCVIQEAKRIAKKSKKKTSVLTFEPHPKCFFKDRKINFRITPFRDKFELIKLLDIDYYLNFKFDQRFSKINAENFIKNILIKKLQVHHVVTGFDFVFGNKQDGDTELLFNESKKNLFKFTLVKEKKVKEKISISSSEVRKNLEVGNLNNVKKILGRNWHIKSRVIKGKKIAEKIGFPTANLKIDKYCKLCFGVYKVLVRYKKNGKITEFDGVANYGIKPTFNGVEPILEVNIFNFNKIIYYEYLQVFFVSFIRKERKFSNSDELIKQIKVDIKACKKLI